MNVELNAYMYRSYTLFACYSVHYLYSNLVLWMYIILIYLGDIKSYILSKKKFGILICVFQK